MAQFAQESVSAVGTKQSRTLTPENTKAESPQTWRAGSAAKSQKHREPLTRIANRRIYFESRRPAEFFSCCRFKIETKCANPPNSPKTAPAITPHGPQLR